MKNKTATVLAVVWLLVMVGIVASTGTLLLSGGKGTRWVNADQYALIERYSKLDAVRNELVENYYQEVDDQQLLTGALRGMMSSLDDPYTFYYSPEDMRVHDRETEGAYHGLGILVQINAQGEIEILRVYNDSPADHAGLQVGDCIMRVDGVRVDGESGRSMDEAVSMMQGEDGTEVRLDVLRENEMHKITAVRGSVNASNVAFSVMNDRIGYISIFQFTGDAQTSFESAAEALRQQNLKGLVIDLRNNPGGILDQVVAIADLLMDEHLIVYMEDRSGKRTDYYSDGECWDVPLVVLVNEMSASASEILAAAVQESGRGTVVGTNTYGKGIVQTFISFEDAGDGMQYTSACYFTPDGNNIHGKGVAPDIAVEDETGYNAYSGIPEPEKDAQLREAVKILKKEME